MNDFTFARLQMARSLGFHSVFPVTGIGMTLLMCDRLANAAWMFQFSFFSPTENEHDETIYRER